VCVCLCVCTCVCVPVCIGECVKGGRSHMSTHTQNTHSDTKCHESFCERSVGGRPSPPGRSCREAARAAERIGCVTGSFYCA